MGRNTISHCNYLSIFASRTFLLRGRVGVTTLAKNLEGDKSPDSVIVRQCGHSIGLTHVVHYHSRSSRGPRVVVMFFFFSVPLLERPAAGGCSPIAPGVAGWWPCGCTRKRNAAITSQKHWKDTPSLMTYRPWASLSGVAKIPQRRNGAIATQLNMTI